MDSLKSAVRDLVKKTCDALLTQQIPIRIWTRVKENGGLITPTTAEERVYWDPFAYLLLEPLSLSPILKKIIQELRSLPEIADKITIEVDQDKEFLIYSGHMAEWLWTSLITPYLDASFSQFKKITFDERLFESVFHRFTQHLSDINPRVTRFLSPLVNLKIVDVIDLSGGVRIRSLSLDEIETWLNDSHASLMKTRNLLSVQCAIEHTYEHLVTQSELLNKHFEAVLANQNVNGKLVNTLRLVTNEAVAVAFNEQHSESVLLRGNQIVTSSRPQIFAHLPKFLPTLNKKQTELLIELWESIDSGPNAKLVNLAFSRWAGAFERSRDEDKLIDYWIGLESLFAPDSNQEVKFRASLRIAASLGASSEERKTVYDNARLSYDWRSAIVHGDQKQIRKLKNRLSLKEASALTSSYLRKAILDFLRTDERFDPANIETQLLMGSSELVDE